MKRKTPAQLILHRETIQSLDGSGLRGDLHYRNDHRDGVAAALPQAERSG